MSVHSVQLGEGDRRQAPMPGGPVAEILIGDEDDRRIGAVQVTVPIAGNMPLHAHGESEALLIPLHGEVRLISGGDDGEVTVLEPGLLVTIPVGEQVRLENPGEEPGRLLVMFSPASFTNELATWPKAEALAAA